MKKFIDGKYVEVDAKGNPIKPKEKPAAKPADKKAE